MCLPSLCTPLCPQSAQVVLTVIRKEEQRGWREQKHCTEEGVDSSTHYTHKKATVYIYGKRYVANSPHTISDVDSVYSVTTYRGISVPVQCGASLEGMGYSAP